MNAAVSVHQITGVAASSSRAVLIITPKLAVFGSTLVLLYTASTLYHSAIEVRAKARLKVLDHASIYLLIAGTYTPFMLGPLRGPWGWSLFGIVWALAAMGVVFKLFFAEQFRGVSTALYVGMGWIAIVAAGGRSSLDVPLAAQRAANGPVSGLA